MEEAGVIQDIAPPRAIRSFVRRAGRMGSGQVRALADLGPRSVLPFQTTRLDAATADSVFKRSFSFAMAL